MQKEGFQGFREGMDDAPSGGDTSLNYSKDLIGNDGKGSSLVDPSGGTVMFYGEDMICQESSLGGTTTTNYVAPASQTELAISYIMIAGVSVAFMFALVKGIPFLLNTLISNCFNGSDSTIGAYLSLLMILFSKHIFALIAIAMGKYAGGKITADPAAYCVGKEVSGFYQMAGGIGGFFNKYYTTSDDNKKCEFSNTLVNPKNELGAFFNAKHTFTEVRDAQSRNSNIKILDKAINNQIWVVFIGTIITFLIIATSLFAAGSPTPNAGFNINKPATISAIFVFLLLATIVTIITSTYRSLNNRVAIGRGVDILYSSMYGYLFVPEGYAPEPDD
jgi:hypothetical protein